MQTAVDADKNYFNSQDAKDWFDTFVSALRTDQLYLETDLADNQMKSMYKAFISGEENSIHKLARTTSSFYFTKSMLIEYVRNLNLKKGDNIRIALDYTDAKVLVWAEIENDDEIMEDRLVLAQAKTNAKFYEYGFSISTTLVEKRDNLSMPPHYNSFFE